MKKGFEDAFMEVQSGLISLCIEAVPSVVDKVFAYASIEEKSQMFNAFFLSGGEVKTINQLTSDKGLMRRFLQLGTGDLSKVREICTTYEAPLPTEMKLYYDVKTKKFDAKYKYESVCNESTGISAGEIFIAWMDEIKRERAT